VCPFGLYVTGVDVKKLISSEICERFEDCGLTVYVVMLYRTEWLCSVVKY